MQSVAMKPSISWLMNSTLALKQMRICALFSPMTLSPGKRYQYLFLKQYWGGDTTYSQERGHPRLRMRHNPYPITQELRDLWVKYMLEAMDAIGIQEPARTIMQEYFERGASAMVNAISHPTDPNGDEV
jgi:hemoglobin